MVYDIHPQSQSLPASPRQTASNNPFDLRRMHCHEVPLSKSLRQHDVLPSIALPTLPPQTPIKSLSDESPVHKTHIPRPPNAFMIYRSDLIKARAVPSNVEHRQQNISRLAGQCWNLMSDEEKKPYQLKAAEALREHQRLHPNYKFTPAPRGSRRPKKGGNNTLDTSNSLSQDDIANIRLKYVGKAGPVLVADRKRKRRAARGANASSSRSDDTAHLPLENDSGLFGNYPGPSYSNPTVHPSPPSARSVHDNYSSSSFPRVTLPRRPSTAQGIERYPPGFPGYAYSVAPLPSSLFPNEMFPLNFPINHHEFGTVSLEFSIPNPFYAHLSGTAPPQLVAQEPEISPFTRSVEISYPQPMPHSSGPPMFNVDAYGSLSPLSSPMTDPLAPLTPEQQQELELAISNFEHQLKSEDHFNYDSLVSFAEQHHGGPGADRPA